MPDYLSPSPLRRLGIFTYDILLVMAVSIFYGLVFIAISKLVFNVQADGPKGTLFQLGWLFTIISFYTYFWRKGGQTTGMRAWRVKILSSEHTTPTIAQCLIRLLTAPIGWLLFITAFFHPQKQWLHDSASKTQLVLLEKEKK